MAHLVACYKKNKLTDSVHSHMNNSFNIRDRCNLPSPEWKFADVGTSGVGVHSVRKKREDYDIIHVQLW